MPTFQETIIGRAGITLNRKSVVTDYTASINDCFIEVDATSGNIIITLPTAVGNDGRILFVKKIDSSSNTVTVKGNGSQLIDGSNTIVLSTQYASCEVFSNNVGWDIRIQGISGYSGFSGNSGYSGFSGKSGFSGYSGYSGVSGFSGFSGVSGYSGFSGYSGYSGYSGFSGYSGISGFSGFSGVSGSSGYSGFSGYSGYSGVSGFSGTSGFSGVSGYSGFSGYSGYSQRL
jgi:hypothetical protein